MNTARSVLSNLLKPFDGVAFGSHRLTERLLAGIARTRPSVPRYTQTWDVAVVLNHLRSKMPLASLSWKDLTFKLVSLVALVTAQRCQTIHLLDTAHMTKTDSKFSFQIAKPLKTSKPGRSLPQVELHKYHEEAVCVYRTLERYIEVTALYRKQSALFLSYHAPHNPVGKDTISRWIKCGLHEAGIDVDQFKAHSTRAASTSAARHQSLPVKDILVVAGWEHESTFDKFYNKSDSLQKTYAESVLSQCEQV